MGDDKAKGVGVAILHQHAIPGLPWRGQADVAQPGHRRIADHKVAVGSGGAHGAQFQQGFQELIIVRRRGTPYRRGRRRIVGDGGGPLRQAHVGHGINGLHAATVSRERCAQVHRAGVAVIAADRQGARVDVEPGRRDGVWRVQIDETMRFTLAVEQGDRRTKPVIAVRFIGDKVKIVHAVARSEPRELVVEAVTAGGIRRVIDVPARPAGAPGHGFILRSRRRAPGQFDVLHIDVFPHILLPDVYVIIVAGQKDPQRRWFIDHQRLVFQYLHRFQLYQRFWKRPERPVCTGFQRAAAQVLDPVIVMLSLCVRLGPDPRLVADTVLERWIRRKGILQVR